MKGDEAHFRFLEGMRWKLSKAEHSFILKDFVYHVHRISLLVDGVGDVVVTRVVR
jgi:hypothetical protein